MTNEQIISKMKDDMKMRGFSHWTEESYLGKTKDIMKYLKKPMDVNGKIICRKMAKKNVVFPTYFLYHKFMI